MSDQTAAAESMSPVMPEKAATQTRNELELRFD